MHRFGAGPPVAVEVTSRDLFRRLLWRPRLGLGESYVAGDWRADDLPWLFELLIRPDRPLARRVAAGAAGALPAARPAAPGPAPGPPQHRLPLRPRQRPLPALPRRVAHVLVRDLGGGRHARAGAGAEAAPDLRAARARAGRPRARDRLRLGQLRAARRGRVRRARHRADDLRAAGRAGARAGGGRRARRPDRDPAPGLPDARRAVHAHRLDRDAGGDRPRAVPGLLRRLRPAARARRPCVRADDRDPRRALRALPAPRRLDPPLHLPGLAAALGRGAAEGDDAGILAPARGARRDRAALRDHAAGLAHALPLPSRRRAPASATTSASSGRGSSTSPTARRPSARARCATSSSCCSR